MATWLSTRLLELGNRPSPRAHVRTRLYEYFLHHLRILFIYYIYVGNLRSWKIFATLLLIGVILQKQRPFGLMVIIYTTCYIFTALWRLAARGHARFFGQSHPLTWFIKRAFCDLTSLATISNNFNVCLLFMRSHATFDFSYFVPPSFKKSLCNFYRKVLVLSLIECCFNTISYDKRFCLIIR